MKVKKRLADVIMFEPLTKLVRFLISSLTTSDLRVSRSVPGEGLSHVAAHGR